MKTITLDLLHQAFRRLGELAEAEGITLELCIYGGSAMMLVYNTRQATKDVDAVMHPKAVAERLAAKVADEFSFSTNWLNDDVKLYLAPSGQTRNLPQQFKGLHLTAPTAGYLLAMKAMAARPRLPGYEGDIDDLRFLLRKLEIRSVDQIGGLIDKYYPDDVLPPEKRVLIEELIREVWE